MSEYHQTFVSCRYVCLWRCAPFKTKQGPLLSRVLQHRVHPWVAAFSTYRDPELVNNSKTCSNGPLLLQNHHSKHVCVGRCFLLSTGTHGPLFML